MKSKMQMMPFWSGIIACLLPMAAGLVLYGNLPQQVAVQWKDFGGEITGTVPKEWAVFVIPLVFVVLHWVFAISAHKALWGRCMIGFVREAIGWLMPTIAIITYSMVYSVAVNGRLHLSALLYGIIGLAILIIASYVPHLSFGSRWGIRDEYTQMGEEHWQKVHWFAGVIWALGGISVILFGWFQWLFGWWMLCWVVVLLAPNVYSAWLKKQQAV